MNTLEATTLEKPQPPTLLKTNQFDRHHKRIYFSIGLIGVILVCLCIYFWSKTDARTIALSLLLIGLICLMTAGFLTVRGKETSQRNWQINLQAKLHYSRQLEAFEARQAAEQESQDEPQYIVYDHPEHMHKMSLVNELRNRYDSVRIMETIEDPTYGTVLWAYLDYEKAYVIKSTGQVVSDQRIIDDLDRQYGRSPEERRSGIIYD